MQFRSVLFLCVANAARSQMAEALARHLFAGTDVRVQSAGSKPSRVHPLAIAAMADAGIGMDGQTSKAVDDVAIDNVDLVITLCADEVCPVAMGQHQRLHWPLPDPDRPQETLTDAERLAHFVAVRDQIRGRLEVLAALREAPGTPTVTLSPQEFHASIRVNDLAASARFYRFILGIEPVAFTHRYVTFVHPRLSTNFVIVVKDNHELRHDTLYHLGVDVGSQAAVVDAEHRALLAGFTVTKAARTTWRGTPLHELWLSDPDGTLVEIYARLTPAELAAMPADLEPVWLTR